MPVLSPCLPLIHSFGHTNGLDVIRSFILFKYTSGVCVRFQMSPADDDTSDVTGQVKPGQSQNVRHFGLGDIGEQNCDVKQEQSQLIGMDSVSDIYKYHLLCFATIIEVNVISGHQIK